MRSLYAFSLETKFVVSLESGLAPLAWCERIVKAER